jgi:hypothetical protein
LIYQRAHIPCGGNARASEWGIALAEELRPQTALTGQQSKHALEDAHAKSKTQDTSIKHPPRTTTSTTTTTTTAQETTQTKYNHIRDASGARIFLVTLYSLSSAISKTHTQRAVDDAPKSAINVVLIPTGAIEPRSFSFMKCRIW